MGQTGNAPSESVAGLRRITHPPDTELLAPYHLERDGFHGLDRVFSELSGRACMAVSFVIISIGRLLSVGV